MLPAWNIFAAYSCGSKPAIFASFSAASWSTFVQVGERKIKVSDKIAEHKDMIGAGNLGMHPVWFNPHEKTRIGAEISNVLQITEMGQLEDFLDLQEIRTRKWFAF